MTQYTVTIESQPGEPTTILRVETTPRPRIVEVTVRACTDGAICSAVLPPVDLAKIATALGGCATAQPPGATGAATAGTATEAAAAETTGTPESTATAGRTGPAQASGPAPARRRRQDTSPASDAAAGERTTRNYRRMPDVAELVRAYREAASVTGLARRYGVPRHTMNAWLGRLRREGVIERR